MARGIAEIFAALKNADVEFIVVGGVAAVLQGAPVTTLDLDIVHRRTPENADRLARALESLNAVYRDDPRRLRPGASHLIGPGHQLTETMHGPLDCLGTVEDSTTYDDLLPHAEPVEVEGLVILVLSLPRLIEIKTKLSRPKDKLMLLQLVATLAERNKNER
jgi:predicted nucleotidyltransferase